MVEDKVHRFFKNHKKYLVLFSSKKLSKSAPKFRKNIRINFFGSCSITNKMAIFIIIKKLSKKCPKSRISLQENTIIIIAVTVSPIALYQVGIIDFAS